MKENETKSVGYYKANETAPMASNLSFHPGVQELNGDYRKIFMLVLFVISKTWKEMVLPS